MHRQILLNPEPAFVIHQHAYRETSLLVEMFTQNFGRIGLVARGAKRAKSPSRHLLQAFKPLLIRWSGRGDLGTLIHIEPRETAELLAGKAVLSGLYLNELMMRFTHRNDPQPELFDSYDLAITALSKGAVIESTLRIFEKRLLQSTGYGLVLDQDIRTGAAIDPEQDYYYEAELGPVSASTGGPTGVPVSGRTLQALAREELTLGDRGQHEAKRLMRYVLQRHLGGRQLESRNLFMPVVASQPSPEPEGD